MVALEKQHNSTVDHTNLESQVISVPQVRRKGIQGQKVQMMSRPTTGSHISDVMTFAKETQSAICYTYRTLRKMEWVRYEASRASTNLAQCIGQGTGISFHYLQYHQRRIISINHTDRAEEG